MKKTKNLISIVVNVILGVGLSGGVIFAAVTLSQDIKVGSGTNDVTLDGDDVYITGTLEVDGAIRLDGALDLNAALTAGSNIISDTDNTDDLGSSSIRWANVYANSFLVGGLATTTSSTGTFTTQGDVELITDNGSLVWGAGRDASSTWDGTDLLIDYDNINSGTSDFRINEDGTNRFIIQTGGFVGIGDGSPQYLLTVGSGSASTTLAIDNTAATGDSLIQFQLSGDTVWAMGIDDSNVDRLRIAPMGAAYTDVFSATSSGISIGPDGFVGINTTSTEALLTVNGSISFVSLGDRLDLDADNDTSLRSSLEDTIDWELGGMDLHQWSVSSTVFNEAGLDNDFRVEGSATTSLFFVDASTNRIGVATTTPASMFTVAQSLSTSTILIDSGGAQGGQIILRDSAGDTCTAIVANGGTLSAYAVACPSSN